MLWFVIIFLLLIGSFILYKNYTKTNFGYESKQILEGLSIIGGVGGAILLLFLTVAFLISRDVNIIPRYQSLNDKFQASLNNENITENERMMLLTECSDFNKDVRYYHQKKKSLWLGIFQHKDYAKCELFDLKKIPTTNPTLSHKLTEELKKELEGNK